MLRLLTYNVFMRPPGINTNGDDFKNQRHFDIASLLRNYDVVCFQELFSTGSLRMENMIIAAITQGFNYWKNSEAPSFFPGPPVDSGLLVISRYPITQCKFQSYGIGILSDSASDKGYIYCKLNVQGCTLHLFNTHLQASYIEVGHDLERQLSVKTRLYQVEILCERVKALLNSESFKKEDLVLVVGDLNINSREPTFKLRPLSFLEPTSAAEDGAKYFCEFDAFKKLFANFQMEIVDYAALNTKNQLITFGEGDEILTAESDRNSKQRLDYIMEIKKDSSSPLLQPITESCKVQQFKMQQRVYTQLSDHYGLSIKIHIP